MRFLPACSEPTRGTGTAWAHPQPHPRGPRIPQGRQQGPAVPSSRCGDAVTAVGDTRGGLWRD